jgi:two-component system, NtrC family, sensor kinase
VVDDDPDVREVIRMLLEDEGYEVSSCGDGSRAWELMHADPQPDLVILDLMLPRMDGWELRSRQRAHSALAKIPVIAISADNSPKAAAIHANAFLHKPVRASDLLDTVDRVLVERGAWTPGEELENVYRLALLGALTASIEHELRNPLACLVTNTQLADETFPQIQAVLGTTRHDSADPAVQRACDEIERRLVELTAMVHDTRVGADRIHDILEAMGKMARAHTERRSSIDLVPLVDAALRLVSGQLRRRARVVRNYRATPPVAGDETRLLQVFLGLLVNVTLPAQPNPPGGRQIQVSVYGADGTAVVELLEQVDSQAEPLVPFSSDPTFWSQEPRTDKALCLAVCRSIVVSYGGSIELHTEADGGHCVKVVLPAPAHIPTISR